MKMSATLAIHIIAASLAVLGGYAALFARKGGQLHRNAGTLFIYAMIVMAVAAAVLYVRKSEPGNVLITPFIAYLVITAMRTVRRGDQPPQPVDFGLTIVALICGATFVAVGLSIMAAPASPEDPIRVQRSIASMLNGTMLLFGFWGDVRVMRLGPLRGASRIRRHLWRMCFALFVASASFFLGQADEIPEPLRIGPLLWLLAFLPLVAIPFWMIRYRVQNSRAGEGSAAPAQRKSGQPSDGYAASSLQNRDDWI